MDVVRSLADRIIVLHQRPARRRRRAGGGHRLADRAGGLSRRRPGGGGMSARLDSQGRPYPHRPLSHPARRRFRRAGGQDDDAARPQRRGQDDHAAHHHGPVARLEGRIALGDAAIDGLPASDVARAGVGYVPETMAVFSDLTVGKTWCSARARGRSTTRGCTGFSASFRR